MTRPSDDPEARDLRRLASQLTLARERERKRIAAELHDNIGQNLAFMRMKIVDLKGDAVFSGFDKNLEALLKLLDQTIAATRSLTFELSPPVLYELGLVPALEWLSERFRTSHGLPISIQAGRNLPDLPDATRGMLFTSVRELIINVIKHAEASHVTVTLWRESGTLSVVVEDDGVGFDPALLHGTPEDDEDHYGLFSIRERFVYAGGDMRVWTEAGRGTRVTLRLPETGWTR